MSIVIIFLTIQFIYDHMKIKKMINEKSELIKTKYEFVKILTEIHT